MIETWLIADQQPSPLPACTGRPLQQIPDTSLESIMPAISFCVPEERIRFLSMAIDSDIRNTHETAEDYKVELHCGNFTP